MNDFDKAPKAKAMDYIKAWPQYLLPHFAICKFMYALTRWQFPLWKNWFIGWFSRRYGVNMTEALHQTPGEYKHFNDFFTRPLLADARPISAPADAIICPVDGTISQIGTIRDGRIFQAKGRDYSLSELVGGNDQWAKQFAAGEFATIYLSPKDYHRIHMPLAARLQQMVYVPGRLFSVNPATTRAVDKLFARNERVVNYFHHDEMGPFLLILVGALIVGGIETVWHGPVTPPHGGNIKQWDYDDKNIAFSQGDEMGRFNMGSTAILIFPAKTITWDQTLGAETAVQLGQTLGLPHSTS